MIPERGPTVRRRRLGRELRRLREEAGLTGEEVARRLEVTPSTISRTETASSGQISARTVRALLDLYRVTNESEREGLLAIAREAGKKGWWHAYTDVTPSWFNVYIGLEADAESIRSHHAQVVPDLLQTEDYTRAVLTAGGFLGGTSQIERHVELRTERQKRLAGPEPLRLEVVLDESVLHRPIGGPEVMRHQLARLAEAAAAPNVMVRIMPLHASAHPSLDLVFRILSFPNGDPDVAYLQGLTNGVYLEEEDDIQGYAAVFERLRDAALSPEESAELVAGAARAF